MAFKYYYEYLNPEGAPEMPENKQGDVLLAWENEAYLSLADAPDDYEIVTPSLSILAQPSVAIVDKVVDKRGTREAATEYLNYLYSDEAQRVAGDNEGSHRRGRRHSIIFLTTIFALT